MVILLLVAGGVVVGLGLVGLLGSWGNSSPVKGVDRATWEQYKRDRGW